MTDTAQDRYRKIRRSLAAIWLYVKRCHNEEGKQMAQLRQRVGRLERETRGDVVIRNDRKR